MMSHSKLFQIICNNLQRSINHMVIAAKFILTMGSELSGEWKISAPYDVTQQIIPQII